MSVRFSNSFKTTGSAAAANGSASVRSASDHKALLLILDTVIAVSIFVIAKRIISRILHAILIVCVIIILGVILGVKNRIRPKPLEAI